MESGEIPDDARIETKEEQNERMELYEQIKILRYKVAELEYFKAKHEYNLAFAAGYRSIPGLKSILDLKRKLFVSMGGEV